MTVLALDTSNYTTSVAVFDGTDGCNVGRVLDVKPGELGLRQSEALFQHIKHLPQLFKTLRDQGYICNVQAVGASTRPRAVEDSYMPCFLAGASQAQALAQTLQVPFVAVSHQQGHLASGAWSADNLQLLDQPFLAWHLSGGTTELLYVEPDRWNIKARCVGGTKDLSAGQLIDRTGVMLGLQFPAGRELDTLAQRQSETPYPVKLQALEFSLSGMENQVKERHRNHTSAELVASFVLETIADVVVRATVAAKKEFGNLPVLCCGGVAANTILKQRMGAIGAIFSKPQYATDNALGSAILTWRYLERKQTV